MRQSTSCFIIAVIIAIAILKDVHAAPVAAVDLQKREGNLLHAFSLGLVAVKDGVFSTLDGIQHPEHGSGSRKDIEKSATEAGHNVGSGIGTALGNGAI
ncbi:uncharacterized protein EV154DRAFT_509772 [Mucor mucedo]|uniref:uncharacterized protein n=1 Tax=Mucor mucedo TaxID=29922 RepID=UPI00221F9AD9|nr:uncharacterized protein EV154DRAFT_509772 [Mucor mucedo]KAI7891030.1 hypothetical protein EV154DRAFT_509772 [Mucor mucedo]